METRIRSLRPERAFLDRGDEHWRPAKVLSIVVGETASIRVGYLGVGPRTKAVATATLPAGAAVGHPLAVRISSTNPDAFTVQEIRSAHWSGGDAPRDEAAAATDDGVWPVIPRSISGEPETWWES